MRKLAKNVYNFIHIVKYRKFNIFFNGMCKSHMQKWIKTGVINILSTTYPHFVDNIT